MRAKLLTSGLGLAMVLAVTSPVAAQASAEKKAACAEAYEASQELRGSGKLVSAEEKLVVCSDAECPSFVQGDCATWLEEVRGDIASIVITARDADGAPTKNVRVFLGDTVLAEELPEGAIPMDPGKYTLRFELEGAEPLSKNVTLKKGQKDKEIELTFASASAPAPEAAPVPVEPNPADRVEEPEEEGKPGKLRPYAYVAGGVGVAGLLGWAIIGAIGSGEENDLRDSCAPNCPQSDVDAVSTKYLLADISLGLGIAGLGTGVALFFLSQPEDKSGDSSEDSGTASFGVDLRATRGGGFATVNGRF